MRDFIIDKRRDCPKILSQSLFPLDQEKQHVFDKNLEYEKFVFLSKTLFRANAKIRSSSASAVCGLAAHHFSLLANIVQNIETADLEWLLYGLGKANIRFSFYISLDYNNEFLPNFFIKIATKISHK